MIIYAEDKITILENPDLSLGQIREETITKHEDAVEAIEEVGHYETITEYPNGGKDVKWVIDTPGVEAKAARDYEEKINVYMPYTAAELSAREIAELRARREAECFAVCDRACWFWTLTDEQKEAVNEWRLAWLDAPETRIVPEKPDFIN